MNSYISLLRGINVSKQKLIKMDDLRKCYENLGLKQVRSYVQSGNLIFTSNESNTRALENTISKEIEKIFGFEVPVFVITSDKLARIIQQNPFAKDSSKDPIFMHFTFLTSNPDSFDKQVFEAKAQPGEALCMGEEVVYLYCPNGYGRTKLHNNFFEAKLNRKATTRNWKTANELLKMALEINKA